MNFSGWTNFEDLARACGYTNLNNNNYKSTGKGNNTRNTSNNDNNNSSNNNNNKGCFDIPNGFQSLNPELFVIIGTILGEIIAGNIPFNVQNALGNWFSLIGQVIMTYNSQQQYFEQGPGTCFNPKNFNADNSSCNNNTNSSSNNNDSSLKNNTDKIVALEKRVNELMKEIEKIKNKK